MSYQACESDFRWWKHCKRELPDEIDFTRVILQVYNLLIYFFLERIL